MTSNKRKGNSMHFPLSELLCAISLAVVLCGGPDNFFAVIKGGKITDSDDPHTLFYDDGGIRYLGAPELDVLVSTIRTRRNALFEKGVGLSATHTIAMTGPTEAGKGFLVALAAKQLGLPVITIDVSSNLKAASEKLRASYKLLREPSPAIVFFKNADCAELNIASHALILSFLKQCKAEDWHVTAIVSCQSSSNLPKSAMFDDIVEVKLPNQAEREQILRYGFFERNHKKNDISFDELAENTAGYNAVDLRNLIQESSRIGAKSPHGISHQHTLEALKDIKKTGLSVQPSELSTNSTESKEDAQSHIHMPEVLPKGIHALRGARPKDILHLIDHLQNRQKYTKMGVKLPTGFLMVGPPGTGKTFMARSIAQELDIPFQAAVMSQLMGRYVGEGAYNIKQLFVQARRDARNHPSKSALIFIDEIDAIGSRLSGLGSDNHTGTLTSLLAEMDGYHKEEGISVYVIGATNVPGALDPALTRAGRFEKRLEVLPPNEADREDIVRHYARRTRYHKELVNFQDIARKTDGFTQVELAALVDEAAIKAIESQDDYIVQQHYNEAIDAMRKQKIEKMTSGKFISNDFRPGLKSGVS